MDRRVRRRDGSGTVTGMAHTSPDADLVERAVARLTAALDEGRPVAPVRDLIGEHDLATAYAVQRELTRRRLAGGAVVAGRKIGLTSPAVQRQLGVDQPDFGVLFADMDVSAEAEVPSCGCSQPKVEAEIAFVLGRTWPTATSTRHGCGPRSTTRSPRSRSWTAVSPTGTSRLTDTVADNASSGLYVLAGHRLGLDEFEPRETTMRLYADDVPVSEGTGAACLGDPLNALAWLARTALEFGDPLRAGQVVLSGALGPMVPAPPGTRIRAEISSLGEVTATFSENGKSEKRDA